MLVGYTSLGSFSAKFTALVGETPSAFQQRYGGRGIPHIPGCYVFMRGFREREQFRRSQRNGPRTSVLAMITNVSLVTVYVTDQDEAKKFYTDILGFEARTDATLGDYRWVTVGHPDHRELEITLMVPGPPLDDEMVEVVRRALARGRMGGLGLRVDDCQKTYEDLTAKGVEFPQPPSDRPYGVEAVMRDNSGNWLVLVEPKSGD